jgi:DNA helicase-2/ATP-dependent DNA helicase PcrA
MSDFQTEYGRLNDAQKEAVNQTEGPLLVIAGPGTGKTQLLSARVAQILNKTDTPAQNILCLTFTENGARNMRDRLSRFIGQTAYDVTISTYHAFGGDLIRRFPEYFTDIRLENPVDELGKRQILSGIVDALGYQNPLKQTRHHLGDLMSTISEVKRALLDAKKLTALAGENQLFITSASKHIAEHMKDVAKMPGTYAKAAPYFEQILESLVALAPQKPITPAFGSLAAVAQLELVQALQDAQAQNKSTPLTAWKNKWLAKDSSNHFCFAGELENKRLAALAPVLESYQKSLAVSGLYDFDDMILKSIVVLERNDALKYTLQEQYLYILLDEYQDTNAAQAKLVQLLTDNPVNERRPNVMAVGDDDQAIYAFQGAQYSNMLDFYNAYRDTKVINLTENYRSQSGILYTAEAIAVQIEGRLTQHFRGMTKHLKKAATTLPEESIERITYASDIAQYVGIADSIKAIIKQGTPASQVAVLAPKHKLLEQLVPYLNAQGIAVNYEKRENILEAPVVRQLVTMSRLVVALQHNNQTIANALWPEVLSYDFWSIPTETIWHVAWDVSDARNGGDSSWSKALLTNQATKLPVQLLLGVAGKVTTESCETILDYLIGSEVLETNSPDTPKISSPLRDYYISTSKQTNQPEIFYDTLSHLIVLRAKLRAYQQSQVDVLSLTDLLVFIDLYEAADQQMLNTNPHAQAKEAVQLMTVFKAKGLEFDHVFLPSCHNDVWGSAARGNSNKLTLPSNLAAIRHAGATDDERLRILFVALTRARYGLHLTSYDSDYTGKITARLKYFDEQPQPDGTFKAMVLPNHVVTVQSSSKTGPVLEALQLDWHGRHIGGTQVTDLRALLGERLVNYQLSPTHLTTFIDMEYGGPESFFLRTLLRFPGAPSIDSEFGNVIHETLEWLQHQVIAQGKAPSVQSVIAECKIRLSQRRLLPTDVQLLSERAEHALTAFLASRSHIFTPSMIAEKNFRNENVFIDTVHMAGKIDRLEINQNARTITVVDYKTGKSYDRWSSDAKLHRYQLQLYCYKLLVEHSRTFKGYTVTSGRLEFIEPDEQGIIHTLELDFKPDEVARTVKLLTCLWQHVADLNFPATGNYPPSLVGIRAFENDLLEGNI